MMKTQRSQDAERAKGGANDGIILEGFLPYRLNVLASLVSQGLARLYQERYGLGVPEWRVLATLGQYEVMTAKTIGRHSFMHKTKVSRAVASLEARGWLTRSLNADDLREAFLSLTEDGRAIYRDLTPLAKAFEAELLAGIPEQDLAAYRAVCALLAERALAFDWAPYSEKPLPATVCPSPRRKTPL